jgi:hypothetical protein
MSTLTEESTKHMVSPHSSLMIYNVINPLVRKIRKQTFNFYQNIATAGCDL